jgi:hypothetical protein
VEEYWAEQLETYVWDYPGGYNLVWCGQSPRQGITHTPEARKKIIDRQLGVSLTESHKNSIKEALDKPETKIKLNARNLGRKATDTARNNISKGLMGHSVSDETRLKISESNKKWFRNYRK